LRSCEGDARATLFIALPALVGNLITNATTTGSFDAEKNRPKPLGASDLTSRTRDDRRDCALQNKQIIRFDMASIGWNARGATFQELPQLLARPFDRVLLWSPADDDSCSNELETNRMYAFAKNEIDFNGARRLKIELHRLKTITRRVLDGSHICLSVALSVRGLSWQIIV
jgi:hypothetical protein